MIATPQQNDPEAQRRARFARSLAPHIVECFDGTDLFETQPPPCENPVTIVTPIIIPIQYAGDEDTQERIAFHLVRQSLVNINKLCQRHEGMSNNYSITKFEVIDDGENQIGLTAHLVCLADIPGVRERAASGDRDPHPEMQTREDRIREILGD